MRKSLQAQSGILFLVLLTGLTTDLNSWPPSIVSTSFRIPNGCLKVCRKEKFEIDFSSCQGNTHTYLSLCPQKTLMENRWKWYVVKASHSFIQQGLGHCTRPRWILRRTSHISSLIRSTVWWEIHDSKAWHTWCDSCVAGMQRREPDLG